MYAGVSLRYLENDAPNRILTLSYKSFEKEKALAVKSADAEIKENVVPGRIIISTFRSIEFSDNPVAIIALPDVQSNTNPVSILYG